MRGGGTLLAFYVLSAAADAGRYRVQRLRAIPRSLA